MVRVRFISPTGEARDVDIAAGLSLMEGAVGQGVAGIAAECGGNCYCATCRVHVDPAWLARTGMPTEFEGPLVESTGDDAPGVRLACQITVTADLDGLIVRLPESQT